MKDDLTAGSSPSNGSDPGSSANKNEEIFKELSTFASCGEAGGEEEDAVLSHFT